MKNKFAIIALSMSLIASSAAFAQEEKSDNKGENFAKHKAEMVSHLNQEKAIIDSAISCINAAQKGEDARKCHENKRAAMEKMRAQMEKARETHRAERKAHLQDKIKKLDEKDNKAAARGDRK